jgi:hypothetical protein
LKGLFTRFERSVQDRRTEIVGNTPYFSQSAKPIAAAGRVKDISSALNFYSPRRRFNHRTTDRNRLSKTIMANGAAAAIDTKKPGGMEEMPHDLCNIPPRAAASTLHRAVTRNSVPRPN